MTNHFLPLQLTTRERVVWENPVPRETGFWSFLHFYA